MESTTNSEGNVVFDAGNFGSEYSNGDVLTYAIEAYTTLAYHLVREAFEDSSVEFVSHGDERLNTATCTVNLKVI